MLNHIKKLVIVMLLVPSAVYADRDSQEYKDCSAKYTAAIVEGNAEAFKNHIIECQGKPDSDVLSTYSNNSYKQLNPVSLTCLGDINNRRNLNVSYTFYKLAAELGNSNAKVSLGLMAADADIARRMDISKELQAEYLALAESDDSFNFLRVMALMQEVKTDGGKEDFKEKYMGPMEEYGKTCVTALAADIEKIDLQLEDMLTESDVQANRDFDAWLYVEGTMLEEKKKRLDAGLRRFR